MKNIKISILAGLILALLTPVIGAHADKSISESFVSTEPLKIALSGSNPGGQFGSSLAIGDFNGDKIDDLAIGSPFDSNNGKEWNGKVSIYFGLRGKVSKLQSYNMYADVVIYGEFSGDQLGTSLSFGDFNNDIKSDLIIGAYNSKYKDIRPGKVYLIYGHKVTGVDKLDLSLSNPDIKFIGDSDGDNFGLSLSSVDINNDNVDDIVIGAPYASTKTINRAGIVYVYFGKEGGLSSSVYNVDYSPADVTFYGKESNSRFGASIASGHISGEQYTDLIIGAYSSSSDNTPQAGEVYFYKGRKTFQDEVKFSNTIIKGTKEKNWFGFSLAVNDLNNDGKDDLVVSSFPYQMKDNNGSIFAFYGGQKFAEDKNSFIADSNNANIVISTPFGETFLGSSLILDDFDKDGRADIVFGAPGIGNPISTMAGDVYTIFSGNKKFSQSYNISNKEITSVIHGENPDDWFGYSIASMDFNGDQSKDLVVGSRYSDVSGANTGKIFIIFGTQQPFGSTVAVTDLNVNILSRGEFLKNVIDKFDLKNKKADEINKCLQYKQFCFFNFMTMSVYNDLKLDPELVLYPDILPGSKYYENVLIGTILGLVNGYMNEKDSPFHPERPISRIQALKVILTANDLIEPKYRFELIDELGSLDAISKQSSYFKDVDPKITYMWWYPRYLNFAVDQGIVTKADYFRPDDNITKEEMDLLITRTLDYLSKVGKDNEKTNS